MAKDTEVSVFERHVEKGVLAICVLLLVYALSHWVSSSPRLVKVPGPLGIGDEVVSPMEADDRLLQAAEAIRRRIDDVEVVEPDLPNWPEEFAMLRREPFTGLTCCDFGLPYKPLTGGGSGVGPTFEPPTLADMEKIVPAPSKPAVWAGWELPRTEDASDMLVGRLAVVFPWGELVRAWNEKLRNTRIPLQLAVIRVRVFRRERTPEGQWGEAKEIRGDRIQLVDQEGNPVDVPKIPQYKKGENLKQVRDAIEALLNPVWQKHILQPEYPEVYWPAGNQYVSWRWHIPQNAVTEMSTAMKIDPKSIAPRTPVEDPRRIVAPPPTIRRTPRSPVRQPDPRRMMPEEFGPPPGAMLPRPPVSTVRRPRQPVTRVPLPGKKADEKRPEGITIPQLPSLEQQRAAGTVLIVVHDTGLESMKYYQYSIQVELVNPLLTYEKELAENQQPDALVTSVSSPRSEWSEAVFIPTATEFFLVGSARDRQVTVRVFAQSLGQRVSTTFEVVAGRAIGWDRSVTVNDPRTGETIDRKVNFGTGSVAVNVEYDRKVYVEGIRNFAAELLYLDAKGRLRTRDLITDRGSPRYRKLLDEAR